MNIVHYDIRDFKWVSSSRTFIADGFDLYDADGKHRQPLPSGRQQFIIKNYKTNNFRRFRFSEEVTDPFGSYWVFESEDNFTCVIHLD